jgi:hypothetical protein
MFAMASDTINLFQLADQMRARGWFLQPQFSIASSPCNLHVSVNYSSVPLVDAFLDDLRESVEQVRKLPRLDATPILALIEQLRQQPSDQLYETIIGLAGISGSALPETMAEINTILDALPDPLADALLTEYFNNLYV